MSFLELLPWLIATGLLAAIVMARITPRPTATPPPEPRSTALMPLSFPFLAPAVYRRHVRRNVKNKRRELSVLERRSAPLVTVTKAPRGASHRRSRTQRMAAAAKVLSTLSQADIDRVRNESLLAWEKRHPSRNPNGHRCLRTSEMGQLLNLTSQQVYACLITDNRFEPFGPGWFRVQS